MSTGIGLGPNGPQVIVMNDPEPSFREQFEDWVARHDENSLDKKELSWRAAVWAKDIGFDDGQAGKFALHLVFAAIGFGIGLFVMGVMLK